MKTFRLLPLVATCVLVVPSASPAATAPSGPVKNKVTFTGEYYEISKVDVAPVPKERGTAGLPPGGTAMIAFVIDENGKPAQVQVASASSKEFGEAAKKAVEKWTYRPGKKAGKIVCVKVMIPIKSN